MDWVFDILGLVIGGAIAVIVWLGGVLMAYRQGKKSGLGAGVALASNEFLRAIDDAEKEVEEQRIKNMIERN